MPTESDNKERILEVVSYQHNRLVQRVQAKLEITENEASSLFDDTKRFLFLCGEISSPLAPPERIDECWHQFILYTEDYAQFCHKFFGHFIHHRPKGPDEVEQSDGKIIRDTVQAATEFFGNNLSSNWSYRGGNASCDKCEPSTACQPVKCEKCSKPDVDLNI